MNARFGDLGGRGPMGLKHQPQTRDGKRKAKPGKDAAWMARVAKLPCVICHEYEMPQLSPTQVHHCIHGRYGSRKVPDRMTIPLCEGHHIGFLDTSKIAIHRASATWKEEYGEDTRWISWVEDRASRRGNRLSVKGECNAEGCAARSFADGFCRTHYRRKMKYGDPLAGGTSQGEPLRWISDNAQHAAEDCLAWPFSALPGYYSVKVPSGYSKAHRVMCEAAHGTAPEGTYALHSCGNASCVNPRHLRWGTPKENSHDALTHGTLVKGEAVHAAKLTEADVRAIRQRWAAGERTPQIATDYPGITRGNLWAVATGKTWKHIE